MGGVTTAYADTAQVLNTGGVDKEACSGGANESVPWTQAAALPSTSTSPSSAPDPSLSGQAVILSATVSSSMGTPTGTVSFSSGGTVLGQGALSGGTASISTTALPVGADTVVASYSGSADFGASSSTTTQSVIASGSPVSASNQYGLGNQADRGPKPCKRGDPVVCSIGNLVEQVSDLDVPGRGRALGLVRTYNAEAAASAPSGGPLGWGWSGSYGASLAVDSNTANVTITQGDGSTAAFSPSGSGSYAPNQALNPALNAALVHDADGTWTFTLANQDSDTFSSAGRLVSESDRNGYGTTLAYNASGQLATVTDPAGRQLSFAYNALGQLATVTDPAGRVVHYAYDAAGDPVTVTDPSGAATSYAYDASHRLVQVVDPRGGVTTNAYDGSSRVVSQTDPMGRVTSFSYASGSGGTHTTTVTDPAGNVEVEVYDAADDLITLTKGSGTPYAATWSYAYDTTGDLTKLLDPDSNATTSTYDNSGNVTSTTDALGRTTSATYDSANDLTSLTDPSGVATTYSYDTHHNLTGSSRPLTATGQAAVTSYAYDPAHPGDVVGVSDPTATSRTTPTTSTGIWSRSPTRPGTRPATPITRSAG